MKKVFLKQLKENLKALKKNNGRIVLLLPQHPNRKSTYHTNKRMYFFVVCGCVIFQQSILTEIIDIIDMRRLFFVDSEKKIPVTIIQTLMLSKQEICQKFVFKKLKIKNSRV